MRINWKVDIESIDAFRLTTPATTFLDFLWSPDSVGNTKPGFLARMSLSAAAGAISTYLHFDLRDSVLSTP